MPGFAKNQTEAKMGTKQSESVTSQQAIIRYGRIGSWLGSGGTSFMEGAGVFSLGK